MGNSIDQIIDTAFSKLKTMADADTIVGRPMTVEGGGLVIPVSKVAVGFVAGGGEYSEVTLAGKKPTDKDFPFAGGSGAGMSIVPTAFIVVQNGTTQVFTVDQKTPAQKLLDMLPEVVRNALGKMGMVDEPQTETIATILPEEQEK